MNSTYIMFRKFKRFWALEAEMSLTAGEKKIFHELDVHHVQKVGIKRFWAQKAELNLTATSLLESNKRDENF